MGKIKILSDDGGVYEAGQVVSVKDLIQSFCGCLHYGKDLIDYVCRIPIPSAVALIAEKWGLRYEFV